MNSRLRGLLFIGFVLHLLIASWFIILPTLLPETRFSRIYKTYLLPGPFFRDDRITTSYNLFMSWKIGEEWSMPISQSQKYFMEYHKNLSPADLYRSRYLRSLDYIFFSTPTKNNQGYSRNSLIKYAPLDADSVHIIVTRKYAQEFSVQVDTVVNTRLNVRAEKI